MTTKTHYYETVGEALDARRARKSFVSMQDRRNIAEREARSLAARRHRNIRNQHAPCLPLTPEQIRVKYAGRRKCNVVH